MRVWHHLHPVLPPFHGLEQLRSGIGALVGIGLCSLLVGIGSGFGLTSLHLVAPLGATAVLVFCVPNSPLAQPWSAIAGNMVSACVALLMIWILPAPWSAGLIVGAAIVAMMAIRALHPPGGAVALLTALDPAPAIEGGPAFAVLPVGLLTAGLVLAGAAYNRATGRVYPFRQPETVEAEGASLRLGLTSHELEQLLDRFNQTPNLGVADLGRLLAAAEAEAARHRFDGTTCADVMTVDLITVRPDTPLREAARLFRTRAIKSLPVVDVEMRPRGIVLQADLLGELEGRNGPMRLRPRRKVAEVMRPADQTVPHDLPVGALLDRLAVQGNEVVPVTRDGRLVGILTRSDIIRLLLRGSEERSAA
ncbi:HPP family protein (plasmid) [Limimaricola variabilis]|uniref:HPP family protein n=1 Tax=Limimaricola variabilis TaxID=1492771 RepID=UPI002AC93457|nr:HPP family protein [Limimaricola variabilis]WPY96443.1 HPP family protein [Limimaricola variabilis]